MSEAIRASSKDAALWKGAFQSQFSSFVDNEVWKQVKEESISLAHTISTHLHLIFKREDS